MPRRKTIKINLCDLQCFHVIASELAGHAELANYMVMDGVIHIQEYVPPVIKDVEAAIKNIRFNYAARKYRYETLNGKELIDQKTLSKMAGVSRQTIALWEKREFISRSDVGLGDNQYFQIKEVIGQLENLKHKK